MYSTSMRTVLFDGSLVFIFDGYQTTVAELRHIRQRRGPEVIAHGLPSMFETIEKKCMNPGRLGLFSIFMLEHSILPRPDR